MRYCQHDCCPSQDSTADCSGSGVAVALSCARFVASRNDYYCWCGTPAVAVSKQQRSAQRTQPAYI
eukprot:14992-Heterococcus_DN1.PRE.5